MASHYRGRDPPPTTGEEGLTPEHPPTRGRGPNGHRGYIRLVLAVWEATTISATFWSRVHQRFCLRKPVPPKTHRWGTKMTFSALCVHLNIYEPRFIIAMVHGTNHCTGTVCTQHNYQVKKGEKAPRPCKAPTPCITGCKETCYEQMITPEAVRKKPLARTSRK